MVRIRLTLDWFPVQIKNVSFLLHIQVSPIVPKLPKSEMPDKIKLEIFDEIDAVIPFNLLGKVITTNMHRTTFRLRIVFGVQSGVDLNITNVRFIDGHFIRVHKLEFLCVSLQELRKHLMINHMKHLIGKSEQNEEDFEKKEITDIIHSTAELIKDKHGYEAGVQLRKPYSLSVHEIFPRLSIEMVDAKLGQRMRNMRRPANGNKNKEKIVSNEAAATNNNEDIDFETFVTKYNILK